jgi:cobalt-zinc-cadmium efflux system membrane fusion protein
MTMGRANSYKKMKNIFLKINSLAILLLLASCGSEHNHDHDHETEEAEQAATPIQLNEEQMALAGIEIGEPQKRVLSEKINCTGTVEVPPQSLASVYSPVQGFVKKVVHLPGDYVQKGEVLTTISHPGLVKLQREFLEAHSQLSFLEKDFQRKQTLAAGDAASQRSLEEAGAKLDLEKARYNGLKAELDMIGIATQHLEENGEIQHSITLAAPVSGYVSKVEVNLGKLVTPEELLFEVVDNSHSHLELQVFAKDLSKIKKGQRIECRMPGSEEMFLGEVHLTGKMIDLESKTAMVHGHFEEEPTPLTPGTFMQATIFTGGKEVWTVPETAVVKEGGEVFIFTKTKDGFEKMAVTTGMSDGQFVEITNADFSGNKQIVLAGAYYVNGSDGEIGGGHSH